MMLRLTSLLMLGPMLVMMLMLTIMLMLSKVVLMMFGRMNMEKEMVERASRFFSSYSLSLTLSALSSHESNHSPDRSAISMLLIIAPIFRECKSSLQRSVGGKRLFGQSKVIT